MKSCAEQLRVVAGESAGKRLYPLVGKLAAEGIPVAESLRVQGSPVPRAASGSKARSLFLSGRKRGAQTRCSMRAKVILSSGIDSLLTKPAKQVR